jgi:PhoPQ-activated pathogenicity-related protein
MAMRQFHFLRRSFFSLFSALIAFPGWAQVPQNHPENNGSGTLADYIAKPDASFAWREIGRGQIGATAYVELLLTSQTWRDVPWKHQLFLLRPASMNGNTHHALLFIHGGRWRDEYEAGLKESDLPREAQLFARLAETLHTPVAVLRQVPFQPLFERREDALIAYTFDRYLATGESDWPLLLPMTKSAVRAMDAIQAIALQEWDTSINLFTVTGASKRGWTTWLTAAMDKRVIGVAPMVIDVLNMAAQMEHQRATWGDVSEEIQDYSRLDLPTRLRTAQGRELLSIVDPYSYRDRLGISKLILLSTNDRYWPLDALKLYWAGLPEPKRVLYVPNQGHGLRDVDRVIGSVSAMHRYAALGKQLPQLTWKFITKGREISIRAKADRDVERVLLWSTSSGTRDFREARWTSRPCRRAKDAYSCHAPAATQGYSAAFAEMTFVDSGEEPFSLSTTVCIAGRGADACSD